MPLPAALLKRLATRGIVHSDKLPATPAAPPDQHAATPNDSVAEEVIAEDYDEMEDPSQYEYLPATRKANSNFWAEQMKRRVAETDLIGCKGCPNKWNVYHKCSVYCIDQWSDGIVEPKRSYLRRRNRLLRKYPLPKGWVDVYDSGCGIHYYWNTSDDTVSWLPPKHPKAKIAKSAAAQRRDMEEATHTRPNLDDDDDDGGEEMALEIQKLLDESLGQARPSSKTQQRRATPSPEPMPPPSAAVKKPKSRDLYKTLRNKHAKRQQRQDQTGTTGGGGGSGGHRRSAATTEDPLDPMDPAAYSDIPRGKWSDGLVDSGNAKSGVDSTASGVLFQMRPYPSPGAVLQSNAKNAAN